MFFIPKNYETLAVVESHAMIGDVSRFKSEFPIQKTLVHEHIHALLQRRWNNTCFLQSQLIRRRRLLSTCGCRELALTFSSLVVKFIDDCWDWEHVTVGLFDAYDISVVGSC